MADSGPTEAPALLRKRVATTQAPVIDALQAA